MKSLVLLPCIQFSHEQAHGGTKSPKQAGDLEWFGCVWQKELLVWMCLGCRSLSSVCRAVFFSSVAAPWRLSAIVSWDKSHGTKVPELGEILAGTSGGHSSTNTDPTAPSLSQPCKSLALCQPCKQHYGAAAGLPLLPAGAQVLLA